LGFEAATCCLKANAEKFRCFERKILRKIFGTHHEMPAGAGLQDTGWITKDLEDWCGRKLQQEKEHSGVPECVGETRLNQTSKKLISLLNID